MLDARDTSMIDLIVSDSKLRPDLFCWFGAIPSSEIAKWENDQSVSVPDDIKQLWAIKGGGDLFESETLLQPSGSSQDNLVLPRSRWFWEKGLDRDHYVFHEGLYISTFRASSPGLCSLGCAHFDLISTFRSLDEWYLLLRAEYSGRYGLQQH